jgi:hypothetical protein
VEGNQELKLRHRLAEFPGTTSECDGQAAKVGSKIKKRFGLICVAASFGTLEIALARPNAPQPAWFRLAYITLMTSKAYVLFKASSSETCTAR